jgi:hypothetical protein
METVINKNQLRRAASGIFLNSALFCISHLTDIEFDSVEFIS